MERTNAQKKPKKRKKSSNKPQQKQSQKQSVVVNIADAVRRRKKSSASKSKATPMPSSQQFAQQQPQFIYATQPPVQQNPLNPSVAVPTQERQFIPLEPPPLVTRTTPVLTLEQQMKISQENADFMARLRAKAKREGEMTAKQLAFNLAQQQQQPAVVAEPMKYSPLAPKPQPMSPVASAEDRRKADRDMPPMTAEPATRPLPRPSKKKSSQPAFTFGGNQFQEEPPLDRYYGFSRKEGQPPKMLYEKASLTPMAMAVGQARFGDEGDEAVTLGLTPQQQEFY